MSELENHIKSYFGIDETDVVKIASYFQPIQLKKGDFFLKSGHYSDRLAFVQSGVLREFVLMDEKEITKWICTKGYFAVDLNSFIFGQPSRSNFQALTDCEMFVIDASNYAEIGAIIPKWLELEKRFIAKCFGILESRILQHLAMSAEERYQQLYQFNKELFNIVPLQYLASMLGITPETLSRLRRKDLDSIS